MSEESPTIPAFIRATCTDCETIQSHSSSRRPGEEPAVVYECPNCGGEILLDLDP